MGAVIALGYVVVLHEQVSAQPWLSLAPDPVWPQMMRLLGRDQAASLSVVRDQPLWALGSPLACMATLLCAFLVGGSSRNAELLVRTVAWSGLGYAAFGIASYLLSPSTLLWRDKLVDRDVLNATFPNRNTAALYFGVVAVTWMLLLCRHLLERGALRDGWASLRRSTWSRPPRIALAGLLTCVVSLMLTGSRAGAVISLLGIGAAALLSLRRHLRARATLVSVVAPVAGAALVSLLVLGGQVGERLAEHGLTGGGRWQTYVATWDVIHDHPLLGTGIGTFSAIFPRYRSGDASIWGIWDRAHSTPLELAAEMGVPLAALIMLAWLVVMGLLLAGALRRRGGAIYPMAGLICGAMALTHSAIDFSLQIPGLAIPVLSLVGIGLAQRERRTEALESDPGRAPSYQAGSASH